MNRPATGRLAIRADSSVTMGTGHVMRCLALAYGWKEQCGDVIFLSSDITKPLSQRIEASGFDLYRINADGGDSADAKATAELCCDKDVAWVILDGYHFDEAFHESLKESGLRVLLIDDYGQISRYSADIVLNQNLSASESLYSERSEGVKLLLGTRYVLLRHEFLKYRGWKREIKDDARRVLVTLGGSDANNVTGDIVGALACLGLDCTVVLGRDNPHARAIEELAATIGRGIMSVSSSVDNMPELMKDSDIAIAAGGTTSWEIAFMGLPSVLFVLAENQRSVVTALEKQGVSKRGVLKSLAVDIESLLSDVEARAKMSAEGSRLVDGDGVKRVIAEMRAVMIRLRESDSSDCRMLFDWANEPDVRAASFNSQHISWEEHQKWYQQILRSDESVIFIGIDREDVPFGQVRFRWDGAGSAEMAVSLSKEYRSAGLGSAFIRRSVDDLMRTRNVKVVNAFIKTENKASLRAFEKAGFEMCESTIVKGKKAHHLVLGL